MPSHGSDTAPAEQIALLRSWYMEKIHFAHLTSLPRSIIGFQSEPQLNHPLLRSEKNSVPESAVTGENKKRKTRKYFPVCLMFISHYVALGIISLFLCAVLFPSDK